MRRVLFSVVFACTALLGAGLFGAVLPPESDAQIPPRFADDILPGVQAPPAETAASFSPIDITMTQGWHYESYPHAIDINTSGVGDPVFVAVRTLEHSAQISAILSSGETASGCSYISVRFVLDLGFAAEDLGEIRYLHVGPSPALVDGERLELASTANGVVVKQAGILLRAAWIPVRGSRAGTTSGARGLTRRSQTGSRRDCWTKSPEAGSVLRRGSRLTASGFEFG